MPTSNNQINDPGGQAVMDAFIEAGVEPSGAYNATQGIENMSSDRVIAEMAVMKAELNARMDALEAATQALAATTSASIKALEATIQALAASTSARIDALDAQMAMLTWAVVATFTFIMAIAATGFFRMNGWWSRGRDRRRPSRSQGSSRRRSTQRTNSSDRRDRRAPRGRQRRGRSWAVRTSRGRSGSFRVAGAGRRIHH